MLCDWSTLAENRERLWTQAAARIDRGETGGLPPFFSIVLSWPAQRQLVLARAEARSLTARHAKLRQNVDIFHRADGSNGRLRIGYLSGDFYDHAVSHLAQSLFGLHDRRQFEIFTYSYAPDDASSYRRRIQTESEHYVDVSAHTVKDLAKRIAADGIQILVDMMGYSGHSRLEVMSLRPAPVQASWLSYPGTTGAEFIDYLVGDRIVTPPERAADFSEKLVLLPHCYLITDHEQPISATSARRGDYGLPDRGFVFCSLNNSYKFEPEIFGVWMRILAQVAESVLWLTSGGATMEANLRREAESCGVDPARLIFVRGTLPKSEHLARVRLADLFLDTHLYNAHTTACDALWAGLPVFTCPGDTFASRVAASLLTAIGLPELIAADFDRYEQMAVQFANHPAALQLLRAKLAAHRTTWPLFDTPRFVRNLERAFIGMWQNYEAGRPPREFEVIEPQIAS
jgi:predicted O-linked N-acetylglucosamine transferase (SPINDLY family)